MPYQFPMPMSGDPARDIPALWDCLWRMAEGLNLAEQQTQARDIEIKRLRERLEEQAGGQ